MSAYLAGLARASLKPREIDLVNCYPSRAIFPWAALTAAAIAITGCGKGLDRVPDLSSLDRYRAQIKEDINGVPQEKLDAYDWAVSDRTFEDLKAKYSGKTYLQIAKTEIEKQISAAKAEIPKLEKAAAEFEPVIAELRKIKAETSDAGPSTDSLDMGDFAYVAHITNASRFDFSSLDWNSALYLDGATEPAATGVSISSFENKGGLKAGQAVDVRMTQDTFFTKDWDTLAVKNAKHRKVVLTLGDAKDFSNKSFLAGAPSYARLDKLKNTLAAAEEHAAALSK